MTLEQRIILRNARQEEAARRWLGKIVDSLLVAAKLAMVAAMLMMIND